MCEQISLHKVGSRKKTCTLLVVPTQIFRRARLCVSVSLTGTDLYFVPKVVVLGDAKSECTGDILGGGPILHHMITVGLKKKG